jgi:predicted RNase H-like nuclease (RuvC/YqgF family)
MPDEDTSQVATMTTSMRLMEYKIHKLEKENGELHDQYTHMLADRQHLRDDLEALKNKVFRAVKSFL